MLKTRVHTRMLIKVHKLAYKNIVERVVLDMPVSTPRKNKVVKRVHQRNDKGHGSWTSFGSSGRRNF